MILDSESLTLAGNKIFKMASDCHYPLFLFHEMIKMYSTEMKFNLFIKVSNMKISSKILNNCEDQDYWRPITILNYIVNLIHKICLVYKK